MKKILTQLLITTLLCGCAGTKNAGTAAFTLMQVIDMSAKKIADELPAGSRVAIVAFESAGESLSDYIMEELTGALFDLGIEVADRQNLEYLYKEFHFQMSGSVSDEDVVAVGNFLAADMVITGQFLDQGGAYRYRASAISVKRGVRASVTRQDVSGEEDTRRLIETLAKQTATVKAAAYGVSERAAPRSAGTYLDRGIMFASRGEYEMAIMDFDEALKLAPDMAAAYTLRGRAFCAQISKVISSGENFSGIAITKDIRQRVTREQIRGYYRAIDDFSRAIGLDPQNARYYFERGIAHIAIGDDARALSDLGQAVKINPILAAAYNTRGAVYYNKGDDDRAIADFGKAVSINPNYAEAYNNLGIAYAAKDAHDKAIANYEQAIRIDSNHAEAYNNRGIAYAAKGDYDKAIADYGQAVRIDSNHAEAYYNRGIAYRRKDDNDRAVADYGRTLAIDPNHAKAYFNRGAAYFAKGDTDQAIADYDQAIRIDPYYDAAFLNRGIAYNAKGESVRAAIDWRSVVRVNPQHPRREELERWADEILNP